MKNMILEKALETFDIEIKALERTSKLLLNNNFIAAVELLTSSHKIIVSGVGKSGIIGQKIAATLSSTGSSAVFLHPVEALHGDIGMVQKGDVVLLLSKSGNTEELIKTIPYLKMRSANIISIVGNISSHLARNSDVVLDASVIKEACPFNLAPTASTTVALAIGDALAVALMYKKNITLEDFSRLHPLGQIGRIVTLNVQDVMKNFSEIATVNSRATFKETLVAMSKKPNGCCCCIDENFNLLGILTDGDVRRVLERYDDIRELFITDVMTKKPVTISPTSPLVEALALMENRENQISILPVVSKNSTSDNKLNNNPKQLLGLVRLHDIITN